MKLSKEAYLNLKSFEEFWPYYLHAHENKINRLLHFFGTLLGITTFIYFLYAKNWINLLLSPALGYAFSWIGHFVFEKNKPATFDYFFWSLRGDFKMILLILKKGLNF